MQRIISSTSARIKGLIHDVLDLAVPPRCASCLSRVQDPSLPICERCLCKFEPHHEEMLSCDAAGGLDPIWLVSASRGSVPALAVIHRFKYSGSVWLAPAMASLMLQAVQKSPASLIGLTLVPVPLHPVRRRERGYNQSALLAQSLSNAVGIEVRDLLSRARRTRSQTSLDVGQRIGNVQGAFVARFDCSQLRVVMVDDVATSGATIVEASKAVRSAGGTVAGAVTFVRA